MYIHAFFPSVPPFFYDFLLIEGVGKSSLISTFVSRYFSEVVPGLMTRVRLPPDPDTSCITTIVDSQGGDAALLAAVADVTTTGGTTLLRTAPSSESLATLLEKSTTRGTTTTTTAATPTGTTPGTSAGTTTTPRSVGGAAAGAGSGAAADRSASLSSSRLMMSTTSSGGSTTTTTTTTGIENVDSILLVYDLDRVETFFRLESHWLPLIERCYHGKVRWRLCVSVVVSVCLMCLSQNPLSFSFLDRSR